MSLLLKCLSLMICRVCRLYFLVYRCDMSRIAIIACHYYHYYCCWKNHQLLPLALLLLLLTRTISAVIAIINITFAIVIGIVSHWGVLDWVTATYLIILCVIHCHVHGKWYHCWLVVCFFDRSLQVLFRTRRLIDTKTCFELVKQPQCYPMLTDFVLVPKRTSFKLGLILDEIFNLNRPN